MSAERATPQVDEGEFRLAMGRFATGVTVVSTYAEGRDHAMTANSVTSVSLDPVLLLVCVEQESRFHEAIVAAGTFGVSILAADQRPAAQWLATRGRPLVGQLDRIPHTPGRLTSAALLTGALARIECRTTDIHAAGDHSIVVGEVLSVDRETHPGGALLYYRSGYGALD